MLGRVMAVTEKRDRRLRIRHRVAPPSEPRPSATACCIIRHTDVTFNPGQPRGVATLPPKTVGAHAPPRITQGPARPQRPDCQEGDARMTLG